MPYYPDNINRESFTARIVENSIQAIIGTDLEGKIRSWNSAAEKLFAYSFNEIIGQDISIIFPPEFIHLLFQIKTQEICHDEKNIYIRNRQGTLLNLEITISSIKDNAGNIIGCSFIAHKQKPSPQAEIFKLLETIKDSIILAKLDGSIIFWNQGSYRLFGWRSQEVYGKNFIFLFDPDFIPNTFDYNKPYSWEGQSRVITATGEKKYVRVLINTMLDENMEPGYLTAVFTDISEIVEAKLKAEQATQTKDEFLANISHEIRTPMSIILGFTELLSTHDLDRKQKEYLELIRKNAQQLLELINDIIDLAKIEAEKMTINNTVFDINEVIRMSMAIFEQQMAKKPFDFSLSISPEVPSYFLGDNKHIAQILNNLLSNAIKFTHEGKIELKLSKGNLENCTDKFPLEFSIQDTGIGITAEKLDYIFEPFTQADSSTTRKYRGTGLGLAISKRLVGLMNGKISVVSKVGEGSKFTFTIPLVPFADIKKKGPENISLNNRMKNKIKSVNSNKYSILLMLKDKIYQRLFESILCHKGYQVTIAINDKQCTKFLSNTEYHLIFFDIDSTDETGIKIMQWIRSQNMDIPIIGIRSNNLTERYSGINDYLDKPIKTREISSLISKYCPLE